MTPQPADQKKKGLSGCVVALLVVGGLLGISCLVGGAMVWRASQSPEGKKIFGAIGKGMEMAAKGVNAPGAQELRDAGCPQALVMDMDQMIGEFADVFDAGEKFKTGGTAGVMVMCQGNILDEMPECDALAGVYVAAVHPPTSFTVSVRVQGNNKPKCQKKYGADGAFIEEVK